MNVEAVSRDERIVGGIALLLAIDLLFLPWFSVSFGPFTFTATATDSPDGWLGVLAVLVVLALLADLLVQRLAPQVTVPAIRGGRAETRFALAVATAVLVALKFLFHVHFSLFGFGFWVAVVLTVALVLATARIRSGTPLLGGGSGPPS